MGERERMREREREREKERERKRERKREKATERPPTGFFVTCPINAICVDHIQDRKKKVRFVSQPLGFVLLIA